MSLCVLCLASPFKRRRVSLSSCGGRVSLFAVACAASSVCVCVPCLCVLSQIAVCAPFCIRDCIC